MERSQYIQASDPHKEYILKTEGIGCGYSYVGKKIVNNQIKGVTNICPKCRARILIEDVVKWRNTGAGLICNACAGTKSGRIVADDNYEILKVKRNYAVVVPDRLKNLPSDYEEDLARRLEADIDWINSELKSHPANPWLYVHRAGLTAKKYRGQKSHQHEWMSDLEKALQIDPDNALIHAWRAYLSLSEEEIIRSLEKVLELDPDYEPAYVYLAHFYTQIDMHKCHDILRIASKRFPDSKRIKELCNQYQYVDSLETVKRKKSEDENPSNCK